LEPVESYCASVIDTLKLAKELHPGQKNNLDALCRRYEIDNSNRTLHGALLDAELLAEVYLAMTRGQESLMIEMAPAAQSITTEASLTPSLPLQVLYASAEEVAAHAALLGDIDKASKGACVWNKLE
jgi:DNA polymerase III subunit epsilon